MTEYRLKPISQSSLPPGIPYIISNEVAERFSFYGMKSILLVYMTSYLVQPNGSSDFFSDNEAQDKV